MDLTPRLLTEVDFREQWRGYSQSDVDDFLEKVAAAVGELQERLREATERATSAERRLLDRSDEDEIRRTLVLAQRTAGSAVEEARAEAERIIADADHRAREQVAEADARLAAVESDIAERTRVELGYLAERRAALQADVDALSVFVDEHRARIRAELARQLAAVDTPNDALTLDNPPALADVELPPPLAYPVVEPVPLPEPIVARPASDEEVARAREDLVEALRRAGVEELPASTPGGPQLYDADEESGETDVRAPEPPAFEATAAHDVRVDDDIRDDDEVEVRWRQEAEADPEPAPAVEHDDDPFLTELRRAVTDTEPLGPRDDDDLLPGSHDHSDAVPSGRFRRRRGH